MYSCHQDLDPGATDGVACEFRAPCPLRVEKVLGQWAMMVHISSVGYLEASWAGSEISFNRSSAKGWDWRAKISLCNLLESRCEVGKESL